MIPLVSRTLDLPFRTRDWRAPPHDYAPLGDHVDTWRTRAFPTLSCIWAIIVYSDCGMHPVVRSRRTATRVAHDSTIHAPAMGYCIDGMSRMPFAVPGGISFGFPSTPGAMEAHALWSSCNKFLALQRPSTSPDFVHVYCASAPYASAARLSPSYKPSPSDDTSVFRICTLHYLESSAIHPSLYHNLQPLCT